MDLRTVPQVSSSRGILEVTCRFLMRSRQNLLLNSHVYRQLDYSYIMQHEELNVLSHYITMSASSVDVLHCHILLDQCHSNFTALHSDRGCSVDQPYVTRHPHISFSSLV